MDNFSNPNVTINKQSDKSSYIIKANGIALALIAGTMIAIPVINESSIAPEVIELPSITCTSSKTKIGVIKMSTTKYKPNKANILKAIEKIKNTPNRGNDKDYKRIISSEHKEFSKLRGRANNVGNV